MEKINLAEILKDCPKGMELDCTMFDNVTFDSISNGRTIVATRGTVNHTLYLDKYGCPLEHPKEDLKCVIFPKGKTTWEGFIPPCKFKDGDVVATSAGGWIGITTGGDNDKFLPTYCVVGNGEFEYYLHKEELKFERFATEEERQKLFDAIKANGYKWNAETKTLEKLVPNKFDITTLKPFDKVLVRDNYGQLWQADLFGFHGNTIYPFNCVGHYTYQCIPYEGNEHLLGTTDNCNEFYKTW